MGHDRKNKNRVPSPVHLLSLGLLKDCLFTFDNYYHFECIWLKSFDEKNKSFLLKERSALDYLGVPFIQVS